MFKMIELYDETCYNILRLRFSQCIKREIITSAKKHKLVHHYKIHLIISLSSLTSLLPSLSIQYLHQ